MGVDHAQEPDPIARLISEAESTYRAAVEDYRRGNLDKAREQFDGALALLLQGGEDLRSDERLYAEFHKLVEDIHSTELAALERGDALSMHPYEPAPMEAFAELTFPVDPADKRRVQREIQSISSDLPLVSNDDVAGVITYFRSRGRQFITNVLKRVGLYHSLISQALREEGLPQDLIYLAGAESAFNPFALSRAGAKGIWQLMLGRALEYGLKKDRWVDEREHPAKSTRAALRHLKDLYQTFGDWYLAMAAYNCGPLTVQSAIEKTGYADFWMLKKLRALPKETENYVPIILATALVAKDPQAYGFEVEPDPPIEAEQAVVTTPTDLRLIAELIERPVEELIRLNPGLLRWTTPPNGSEFVLNLPPGTKQAYEEGIVAIPPDKRVWWRAYKVQPGDTLSGVARRFRVSVNALAAANQLSRNTPLVAGSRLVLPLPAGSEASLVRARGVRRLIRYRVRRGDTLDLVADRFDVTPYQIRRWNGLRSTRLVAGRLLRLYVLAGRPAPQQGRTRRPTNSITAASSGRGAASAPASGSQRDTGGSH